MGTLGCEMSLDLGGVYAGCIGVPARNPMDGGFRAAASVRSPGPRYSRSFRWARNPAHVRESGTAFFQARTLPVVRAGTSGTNA